MFEISALIAVIAGIAARVILTGRNPFLVLVRMLLSRVALISASVLVVAYAFRLRLLPGALSNPAGDVIYLCCVGVIALNGTDVVVGLYNIVKAKPDKKNDAGANH